MVAALAVAGVVGCCEGVGGGGVALTGGVSVSGSFGGVIPIVCF